MIGAALIDDAMRMEIESFIVTHQRIRINRPGTGVRELIAIWYRSRAMQRLGWKVDPKSGELVPRLPNEQKGAVTSGPVETKTPKNEPVGASGVNYDLPCTD